MATRVETRIHSIRCQAPDFNANRRDFLPLNGDAPGLGDCSAFGRALGAGGECLGQQAKCVMCAVEVLDCKVGLGELLWRLFAPTSPAFRYGMSFDSSSNQRRRIRLAAAALVALWLLGSGFGMGALIRYVGTRGDVGDVPSRWPPQSALPHHDGRPQLLVFLHPRCPCSTATLRELQRYCLSVDKSNAMEWRFVFSMPRGRGEAWARGVHWRHVRDWFQQEPLMDWGLCETRRFGVRVSGHVLLYDRDGALLFSGGVTNGRGHEGDNRGMSALVAAVQSMRAERQDGPVLLPARPIHSPAYGCAIIGSSDGGAS